jgi:hypothetical protein
VGLPADELEADAPPPDLGRGIDPEDTPDIALAVEHIVVVRPPVARAMPLGAAEFSSVHWIVFWPGVMVALLAVVVYWFREPLPLTIFLWLPRSARETFAVRNQFSEQQPS